MAIKLVTSWKTLFQYAGQRGQAYIAWKDDPTPENKTKLDAAQKRHDDYRDLCLEADRMIGLEL